MQQAANTWIDYLGAISTALAAIGTLAAVIVALYLNVWREQGRRPSLSLEDYEETWFGIGWDSGVPKGEGVWGIPLLVCNAPGRNTAHQVQVLVSFAYKLDGENEWFDYIEDQPLVWKSGRLPDEGPGIATTDLPPGVRRKVFVAFIGEPNELYRTLWPREGMAGGFANEDGEQIEYDESGRAVPSSPPVAGVLATYPFTQEDPFWFWRDQEYRVRFVIATHDSDATTYEATVSFEFSERSGRTAEIAGRYFISPRWSEIKKLRG